MNKTVRQFLSAVACAALLAMPAFAPPVRAQVSVDSIDLNITANNWWYMFAFSLTDGTELGEYLEDSGVPEEDVNVDLTAVNLDEWAAVYLYDGADGGEQWVFLATYDFSD